MSERDTQQLNLKIDSAIRIKFAAACQRAGRSQRHIVETLIEAWLAGREGSGVRHLNGDLCPLSVLIEGLAQEVRDYSNHSANAATRNGAPSHGE